MLFSCLLANHDSLLEKKTKKLCFLHSDYLAGFFAIMSKAMCRSINLKPFAFYVGWLTFSFWYMFIVWFRPLFLHFEIVGIYPIYADKSSCVFTPPSALNRQDYVYNPEGVFPLNEQFDINKQYAHCVMFTEWASTTGVPINGYLRNSAGDLDCDMPQDNAFIFNENPLSGVTCGYENFKKNLAFGISVAEPTDLADIVAEPNIRCPTTDSSVVQINGQFFPGRGQKICPICLNYFRYINGVTDNSWPPVYAHCPYDANLRLYSFCFFCPTKCAKSNPKCTDSIIDEQSEFSLAPVNAFWNPNELIGINYQGLAIAWISVMTYSQILKIWSLVTYHYRQVRKFEKLNNLKVKKSK